jgi:hypothetical protein
MCSATDSFDIALQLMALIVNRCLMVDQSDANYQSMNYGNSLLSKTLF